MLADTEGESLDVAMEGLLLLLDSIIRDNYVLFYFYVCTNCFL